MTEPNVLITGSNGFLGSEIVHQAILRGMRVKASSQEPCGIFPNVAYAQADITKPEQLLPLVEGTSTVIHAAGLAHQHAPSAETADFFRKINVEGTINLLNACIKAGVAHLVLVSSVSVYGPTTAHACSEESPCNPTGAYALSKYTSEMEASTIAQRSGIKLTVLRLATLYGAGDPGNVKRLMLQLDKGQFIWIGDGQNRKSLLHKRDAASACIRVAENPESASAIYNVSGPPYTMRTIVETLSSRLGRSPIPLRIPASLALYASKQLSHLPLTRIARLHTTVEKWLADDVYDTSRIERDYGFHAQTSLEDGLREEVAWFRSAHQK